MLPVSVIMPVYNGARYLSPAIESLLAQTRQDWELIVVDDGSTDETPEILKRFTDPRIHVIRQPNGGEAVARNTGLDNARGLYIAFLDADDLYLPNALADLAGYLDANPEVGVVFSDGYVVDSDENILMRLTEHRPGIYTGNILAPLILSPGVITVPVCTLTRKATVEAHNIRFDRELVIGPDYDFWIQLAAVSQFGYLDRLTCKYRVHLTNIQRTSGKKRRRDDLVRGRLKVLHSPWFNALDPGIRYAFFYNLLVFLLFGEQERQTEILRSGQFGQMSGPQQASLLRHMATEYLLKGTQLEFARELLKRAVESCPEDNKSRLTLGLMSFSQPMCSATLRAWSALHLAFKRLRSIGRKKSKPMPASLLPTAD